MKQIKTDKKNTPETISRKEAIKKVGKYAALTAATMIILMPSKKAAATSSPQAPTNW